MNPNCNVNTPGPNDHRTNTKINNRIVTIEKIKKEFESIDKFKKELFNSQSYKFIPCKGYAILRELWFSYLIF